MCKVPVGIFYSINIMPLIVEINFPKNIFAMCIRGSMQSKVLSMWVIIHWTGTVCIVPRAVGFGG